MANKKFYGIAMATTFGQDKGEIAYFTTAEKALEYIKTQKPKSSWIEGRYEIDDKVTLGEKILKYDRSIKDWVVAYTIDTVFSEDINKNLLRTFRGENGHYFKIIEHTFED